MNVQSMKYLQTFNTHKYFRKSQVSYLFNMKQELIKKLDDDYKIIESIS